MRCILLFLLLGTLQSLANIAYPQSAKLSIHMSNVTVQEVLQEIERKSTFYFSYNTNQIDAGRKISINLENKTVEDILDKLFYDKGVKYTIEGKYIALFKTNIPKESSQLQQQNTVKGKVTDQEGVPLPGVTIVIEGTTRGVITDIDGTYSINAQPTDKLVFTFVGMDVQIVTVGDQTTLNVIMSEKVDELEEVTIVAFGKQKKESVVASISTVRPQDLKVPSSNLTTALAGKVAGIISYQRSGEPGQDNADFFIRGVTSFGYKVDPLILIDNVEMTTTELSRLQPDDIASFSIMKDATATALYGARGANGVILVTTKSGVEGKMKINGRIENSISMPTRNVELADPVTYMKLHNEAVLTRNQGGGVLPYSQEAIDATEAGINPYVYPANDWRKQLFRDHIMNQRVNLNISGGGKIARYYVAGAFTQDNGLLRVDRRNNFNNNIDLKVYNLRSNVNINLAPTTEMIIRMNGTFDEYTGPIEGGRGMYNMVMQTSPTRFPAFYPKDEKYGYVKHIMFGNYGEGDYRNPYAEMVKGYKNYSRSVMLAQLELRQDLSFVTKGLDFRALMNTNRSSYFEISRSYEPFYYLVDRYNRRTNEYDLRLINEEKGTEFLGYNEGDPTVSSVFYLESALSYNRTFMERHGLSGMLVYTMRQNLETGAKDLQLSLPSRNIGLSGRATYSYSNRYFMEFNFGYNGAERFHKSHRFGFFPSMGMAWNISNESFCEPYKRVVSNLRLKGTYGLVGNDAIGDKNDRFFYLSNINMNATGAYFGTERNYYRTGVSVIRYANEDISWEKSRKMNLAIELELFGKLNIQAEHFREYRTNILMTRADIPASLGLSSDIRANIGEASGKGMDISIDYNHYFNKNFWIQGLGNFTYATNQYKVYEEPVYDEPWRSRIGHSIQQEWGYIAERLFIDEYEVANSPRQFGNYMAGDIKYRDVNGDGRITEADMVPIGFPTVPEIVYGFGLSIGYKSWDISAFFQGVARESFQIGTASTAPFIDFDGNAAFKSNNQLLKAYAENHWSEENNRDVFALWPRLSETIISNNNQRSTWFQRDGSFLRLKKAEIGYTLPNKIANKFYMKSLRVYVSGINLLCWSKFKLWDVEMANNGLGYPIQKVYNIGLYTEF